MKKYISVALVLVMLFACTLTVFAANTFSVSTASKTCTLDISATTATCKSSYSDRTGSTSKIEVIQTLEKQGFLWLWSTYAGEWTKTANGASIAVSNKVYNLESGKYRVKTVFRVVSDGNTEETTVYSLEQTVS